LAIGCVLVALIEKRPANVIGNIVLTAIQVIGNVMLTAIQPNERVTANEMADAAGVDRKTFRQALHHDPRFSWHGHNEPWEVEKGCVCRKPHPGRLSSLEYAGLPGEG
jgi:hypothetical protein